MIDRPRRRAGGLAVTLLLSLFRSLNVHAAGAPAGRFSASNGTVLDSKTGLVWQQIAPRGIFDLTTAANYCASGTLLPGTGWRLPTIKELQSIVDDRVPNPGPTIDPIFMNTMTNRSYWSSTPGRAHDPMFAFSLAFGDGSTSVDPVSAMGTARCVR